jgi:light-regulated signal transduction histidine kinase (bacteriophytochrome)
LSNRPETLAPGAIFPARSGPVPPVTLGDCAREPIHIPGSIQPHGALLVLDSAGTLVSKSANASAMLGLPLNLGSALDEMRLGDGPREMVLDCLAETSGGEAAPTVGDALVGGKGFDCIVHAHQGLVIVEYERRDMASETAAGFALKAHSAIGRMKRQTTIAGLLQSAVEQVRTITGFDRVMAYRFRHDDSGDVVAETRIDTLAPFLGLRYPAGDIPSQARRLYIVSTLRLISDVDYAAVPMTGRADAAPLDMSYCVLRSVSPIHLEYLKNMGVQASMSLSIVINGRLWGLIACHHQSPRQVPYTIRMAAELLAQVLATAVHSLEMRAHATLIEHAALLRARVMESLLHGDDELAALIPHAPELASSLGASALVIVYAGRVHVHGEVAPGALAAVVQSLPVDGSDEVRRASRDDWPVAQRQACATWVGMLGIRYDAASAGWLLALREEQVESVRWAGKPEKEAAFGAPTPGMPGTPNTPNTPDTPNTPGPLGSRLTPRGSFDEWRETVVGRCDPWEPARIMIAAQLLAEMNRATVARQAETAQARAHLLAVLGHDLRNPLHTINMAAMVLEKGGPGDVAGRRIKASSGRMERLIAQVLDMSQISGGMRLGSKLAELDLVPVLADVLDEFVTARPGIVLRATLPERAMVSGDADRIAQVVDNLVSNACHHGKPGEPVDIALHADAGGVRLEVSNVAEPIDADTRRTLYQPFKRAATDKARNEGHMGLGLYISQQIMLEHGGDIAYRYAAPHVVFGLRFPAPA